MKRVVAIMALLCQHVQGDRLALDVAELAETFAQIPQVFGA